MAFKRVKYQVEDKKYGDTRELFNSLFGRALNTLLRREKIEKAADRYEEARKLPKKKALSPVKDDTPKRHSPNTGEKTDSITKERPMSPVKDTKSNIGGRKTDVKIRKTKRRKRVSQKHYGTGSSKLRTVMLFILFLTLVGTFINWYGIVGFSKLPGSLKSIKKEDISQMVAFSKIIGSLKSIKEKILADAGRKASVKMDKKPLRMAIKFSQENVSLTESNKATPKRRPIKQEHFPEEKALSYPYSVSLGSYRTLESVEKAVSNYQKKGLSIYWVKVDLGEKGEWFRVFTGHFESREKAEEFIKEGQLADATSRKTKYANLIGTYKSEQELNRKKLAVSALGYCLYVVDGIKGESLLYAGAFYQKARAEKQRAELASKGITSRVVER
ncbi:MAG: SPOR domain-containing protein [Deltaproteobacteria bacterium]|nr:MAG: SPOR domain-containing protein [Deltaproteobacteria bacterium]